MFQGLCPLALTEPTKGFTMSLEPQLRFISQFIQNAAFFPSWLMPCKNYQYLPVSIWYSWSQHFTRKKLQHYGISGIVHRWFKSYLENRKQFVSISGVEPELGSLSYSVSQGSVLRPLLLLFYINGLHYVIKTSPLLHCAHGTCLLNMQSSMKEINRTLNKYFEHLAFWLNANKILLNITKQKFSYLNLKANN